MLTGFVVSNLIISYATSPNGNTGRREFCNAMSKLMVYD